MRRERTLLGPEGGDRWIARGETPASSR
jgi:hypothetical protein